VCWPYGGLHGLGGNGVKCCQCGKEDITNTGLCLKCIEKNWIQSSKIKELIKHEI
jgi:NMD protein affecting ribosome stability and mRNA decay